MWGVPCKNCGRQEASHTDPVFLELETIIPGFKFSSKSCPGFKLSNKGLKEVYKAIMAETECGSLERTTWLEGITTIFTERGLALPEGLIEAQEKEAKYITRVGC